MEILKLKIYTKTFQMLSWCKSNFFFSRNSSFPKQLSFNLASSYLDFCEQAFPFVGRLLFLPSLKLEILAFDWTFLDLFASSYFICFRLREKHNICLDYVVVWLCFGRPRQSLTPLHYFTIRIFNLCNYTFSSDMSFFLYFFYLYSLPMLFSFGLTGKGVLLCIAEDVCVYFVYICIMLPFLFHLLMVRHTSQCYLWSLS